MTRVTHKQIYRKGPFGSVLNTTLCGRLSHAGEEMNVDGRVTCKLCLKRMQEPGAGEGTK